MKSPFNDANELDDIFRRELKDLRTPAPRGVWNKISAQLVKRNPVSAYIFASVLVVALLIIGWWSSKSPNFIVASRKISPLANQITNQPVLAFNTNALSQKAIEQNPLQLLIKPEQKIKQLENRGTIGKTELAENSNTINEPVTFSKASNDEKSSDVQLYLNSTELQRMLSKPGSTVQLPVKQAINYCDLIKPRYVNTPTEAANSNAGSSGSNIKGFYTGINGSFSTVWILDHVALQDKDFNYKLTPGFAYGVQGGYNFSDNFGLETGITINAREGQNYTYHADGIIAEDKSVVLNYTKIPLIAKFKTPQISAFTQMPVVLNLNIGVSYGYLKTAYTFVDGDKSGSQNQYPSSQYSIIGGFSYDIYTKHAYSFSFGLMGQYGLNTTKNDDSPPSSNFAAVSAASRYVNGSDFDNPHNLSIGINAAINYNFSLFHR